MDGHDRWITYRGTVDAWECDQMQQQIRSALARSSGKIVHMTHHVKEAAAGRELATMATAYVFFDVAGRNAIAIPDRLTIPVS